MLLTKLREEEGLTRARLGALARVHPARVGQIENGRVIPYPPELGRLAEALGWEGEPERLLDDTEVAHAEK
jgi:transcriptional regulator with XRE-family HTH domain